ncbi:alpha/beta fold hydrolase [Ramlibacter ginsenosidimutans]|uniref:Alpha/beta fold hydrolase n=1 Tax=Ramlibacter ginsenosidimutans TaxID=502333 RepID=A0A934TX41_9BURK|nr:alpha/beta fold hydrolase [Ramlibacter ginsenosidimutans]
MSTGEAIGHGTYSIGPGDRSLPDPGFDLPATRLLDAPPGTCRCFEVTFLVFLPEPLVIQPAFAPAPEGQVTRSSDPAHLVLLHGLASSPKEFGLLARPLQREGIVLHTPTINGYSHASPPHAARWQDWLDASCDVVDRIAQRHGPVVLGGLCTGAVLALGVAAREAAGPICGLALLSPLLAYDGWALPWWYGLRRLAYLLRLEDHFFMRERPPYGLKNERLRQWVRQQMDGGEATLAGPAQISLHAVRESERISREANTWFKDLSVPTLVLHAREDEICSLASVQKVVSRFPTRLLELVVLEDSYHMITADNDRQQVADRLARHARACLAAGVRTQSAVG